MVDAETIVTEMLNSSTIDPTTVICDNPAA
jgi:hypothetical protein